MAEQLLDIPVTRMDGSTTTLGDYAGKVVLVVNVASKCGFTPQYEGLEALYRENRARGLEVLGFPANDFGSQEPGSDAEISEFCTLNFGVDFPMFSKVVAKGADKHPLYQALIEAKPRVEFKENSELLQYYKPKAEGDSTPDEVAWNFEKFLIDRSGKVVRRFSPDTEPKAPVVLDAIEKALAE